MKTRLLILFSLTLAIALTLMMKPNVTLPQALAFGTRFLGMRGAGATLAGLKAGSTFATSRPWRRSLLANPVLQDVASQSDGGEHERYRFVRKWGALAPPGAFNAPFAIAVDSQGDIFVGDMQNSRIEKFDSTGRFLLQWGGLGHGKGQFWLPQGVAVDSGGNVFVTDTFNNRIQEFTNSGAFIRTWGTQGTGDGEFQFPAPLAFDSQGDVFVSDGANNRIQKFTHDGIFISKWGSAGTGRGQFNLPYGVAVDASGNVFVSDAGNDRIQKFTTMEALSVHGAGLAPA